MEKESKKMNGYDPTKCSICVKNEPVDDYAGICVDCYKDGWRAGKEMFDAIREDDAFLIDRHGNIRANPLHREIK
jgi:hypothetical protein